MRILKFSFVLFVMGISPLAGQGQTNTEKVVRGEDDRLYVNKNEGIFLWISTSPDPGSEKIRLLSDSSSKYSNPMYFDTEGYNTVRNRPAVDTATKKAVYPQSDVIFEVYADGLSPRTKANYSSTAFKEIQGKKYYSGDLKVDITSTDAVSGVNSMNYSLNGEPVKPYKGTLDKFSNGENKLVYFSSDKVGNIEENQEDIFYIDTRPPETSYRFEGEQKEKYVSAKAKIILESKDDLSGVKSIFYSIDGKPFKNYYTAINATQIDINAGTMRYYAEDQLGNKEEVQVIGRATGGMSGSSSENSDLKFEFYVDNDPPDVTIELKGDIYKGKYQYVSPRTQIIVNAKDEKAGVEKILYSINSNTLDNIYNAPLTIPDGGLYYLRVKSTDYVGNTSAVLTNAYYCDGEGPEVDYSIGKPMFESRDTLFISSITKITFSSRDLHAGTSGIAYTIDKSSDTAIYDNYLTIKGQGFHSVNFFATDKVNNTSEKKSFTVYVDNTPPDIHYHFSIEPIGSKIVRDENYTIYPSNAMIYIAATDSRSGNESIRYRINDGDFQSENPIKGLKTGNYIVEVEAFDVLSNMNTQEIKFAIEQ